MPFLLHVFAIRQRHPRWPPWKEVKRVLRKFQESTISPIDPLAAWPTLGALSHSPLTSFPLALKVQGAPKGAYGGGVGWERRGEGDRGWLGVMHREKIRYPADSRPPPFSFSLQESTFPPFHFVQELRRLSPPRGSYAESDGTGDIAFLARNADPL